MSEHTYSSASISSPVSIKEVPQSRLQQQYSCVACKKRKVRCDRQMPCLR
ncbi:hypothetical protein BKA67DRAFT_566034 [Truncatella angustata]|uniref:Zn(2)-C6 fungal-type domain-containing protein n=1 Tax=Truncatella angustata TaxID=152316 RepID=A0A9P8ZZ55_9PEZI|nr:uncharacterized protein BKA67DRAFT_566034 [Truncatella angustata]KAH6654696.1 hypothetical protein BKA67DRAFT_566034 [Truncatella angustata]